MTPDLAERWESASDGSSMTFHLRGNALWHDGTPLTSEDVAWTYHMYLNGETGSKRTGVLALIAGGEEYTKGEADSVTGIVAVDDRTIRFEQAFPNILFLAQTTYPILPKHLLGDTLPIDLAQNKFFFDEPLGSGPFKFVSYIPDQRIELEANDDYYFGRPKIDREIISVIKSPDAVQIALQRGEIHLPIFDGGENASTEQFQAFIQDPRFTVSASKGTTLISYAFNSRREDLVNDKMRQAFLHALDRQRLVDTFAQGKRLDLQLIPGSRLVPTARLVGQVPVRPRQGQAADRRVGMGYQPGDRLHDHRRIERRSQGHVGGGTADAGRSRHQDQVPRS